MKHEETIFYARRERIVNLLKIAQKSQYYKKLFEQVGINLDQNLTYDDFCRIPCMDKNIYSREKYNLIVNRPNDFDIVYLESIESGYLRNQYLDQFGMRYMITSGSTGQPLEVLKSYRGLDKDYVTLNLYRKKITNYNFKGQFLWIWPENPVVRKFFNENDFDNVAYRRENAYGYKYMLFEHSASNYCKIYQFMVNEKIEWITSSPSVLYELALYMKDKKLTYQGIKYIECHSEKLHSWQKEMIELVFNVSPVSIYSSNEIQFIGATCPKGNLHLLNSSFIEFVENSSGIKEIYVTSFNETVIPLIRYKLGDCGEWRKECKCGFLNTPSFNLKGFRVNDLILTKYNTQIEPFVITDSIYLLNLKYKLTIREHKVVQTAVDKFEYHILQEQRTGISETELISFLTEYLEAILKYKINITIHNYDSSTLYGSKKYRYFENKISNS